MTNIWVNFTLMFGFLSLTLWVLYILWNHTFVKKPLIYSCYVGAKEIPQTPTFTTNWQFKCEITLETQWDLFSNLAENRIHKKKGQMLSISSKLAANVPGFWILHSDMSMFDQEVAAKETLKSKVFINLIWTQMFWLNLLLMFQPAWNHFRSGSQPQEWLGVVVRTKARQALSGVLGGWRGQKAEEGFGGKWKSRYFLFEDEARSVF